MENIRRRTWMKVGMVRDYFNGLSDADKLKAENLFVYTSFTRSPLEETAKFMIANRSRFEEASRQTIADRIDELYRFQMLGYLAASVPYNEADYQAVKKGLDELGKLENYAAACEFIECHAQGDLNAYLDYCQAHIKELSETEYTTLIMNFSALFENGDEAVKQRAAKFIRSQLPEMPVNNLFFIGHQIGALEGSLGKH